MGSEQKDRQQANPFSGFVPTPSLSPDGATALLENLRIHQIELELQNEELRNTQAALETERSRYFALYELAPVGYLTLDEKGAILQANLRAATLFALDRSSLIRTMFTSLVSPADQDAYYFSRKSLLRSADPQVCTLKMVRTDGSPFWAQLEMSLGRESDPPVCRIVALDVTERKLAEQRFDAFMTNTPAPCAIVDEAGSYVYANPAMQKLAGRDQQSITGKTFADLWPAALAEKMAQSHRLALSEGKLTTETISLEVLGQERTFQVMRFPFAGPNGSVLIGSTAVDVTEREYLEQALRAGKKAAEEATAAKSQFLSTMSHEIRTPLNGVIGMAGLLINTDLSEEQLSYARIVADSAEALLRLVNDILDFSKLEAGKLDLDETSFDLESLIEDGLDLMSFRAREKCLELACWYPAGAPRRFVGDAARLRQVLTNFLSNSIKFTYSGYVLVEVEADKPLGAVSNVRLSIHDTGIGISKSNLAHLFENFRQADSTIARRFGGTGLGLSIVKQIIELMGGELAVKSVEGEGSTFSCRIPLKLDLTHVASPVEPTPLAGLSVLVCGSPQITRFVVSEWCQRWGMTVEQCGVAHLREVLSSAALDCREFQIVIVDGNFSEMSQAVSDVRLSASHPCPRLVLLSADPSEKIKDLPADAVLSIPIRAGILAQNLRNLVDRTPIKPAPLANTISPVIGSGAPAVLHRVLVVDDNAINQKLACALLSKLGCELDTADNGEEAIEKIALTDYELIFMDCVMPTMDGFAAAAAIRRLNGKCSTVPIVALTASATIEDRDRCLAAGMNDFLTKPIRSEQLAACLEKWIVA